MKSLVLKFGLPVGLGVALTVITFIGLLSTTFVGCIKAHKCLDKDKPLSCLHSESCCGVDYPYNDGQGHCHSTWSACYYVGGSACELCKVE